MSRRTGKLLAAALTLVTLATAGFTRPVSAQAPEQAFMNRIPVAPSSIEAAITLQSSMSGGDSIDGARALLGLTERSPVVSTTVTIELVRVNGERALLGRWIRSEPAAPHPVVVPAAE